MLVAMATNTLIRVFGDLELFYKIFMAEMY